MATLIKVKSINEEYEDYEESRCDKCFHFWGETHPLLLLWVVFGGILTFAIIISENYKK